VVYGDTAVCVTIIRKTDIQTFIYHELSQNFNVCGTAATVDVGSVWLIVDHIGFCTKCVKNTLGNGG
jgi:hypothetical protein